MTTTKYIYVSHIYLYKSAKVLVKNEFYIIIYFRVLYYYILCLTLLYNSFIIII